MKQQNKFTSLSNQPFSFMIILLILFAGCASNKAEMNEDVTQPAGEVRIFEVFGMDCPGCHGGLEKLIKKLPGVIGATANWEQKQLEIILTEGAELDDVDVIDAIERANFTVGERIK